MSPTPGPPKAGMSFGASPTYGSQRVAGGREAMGQLPAERELTRCLRPSQTEEDNPNLTAGDEGLLKVTRPLAAPWRLGRPPAPRLPRRRRLSHPTVAAQEGIGGRPSGAASLCPGFTDGCEAHPALPAGQGRGCEQTDCRSEKRGTAWVPRPPPA